MTRIKTIIPAIVCAVAVAASAVPASAHPFGGRGGWGGRPVVVEHRGWGPGRALAFGGLGLAAGALIATAANAPATYPTCGETVSTHYDAYGAPVKVVTRTPC